jgi:histidinol phosphatase-like enzyme (inositol monophosphatase family)
MPSPTDPLQARLQFAVAIARQAGEQTLELFRTTDLDVERKSDGSPVTDADRAAEQLLRGRIAEQFPKDAILGEEFGETAGTSGYRWVLDPIDGTKSFVSGVPLYTTLVAVLQDDQPQLGVIFAPAAGEMVYAARGSGCWQVVGDAPPRQCHVSEVDCLADAVFLTTSVRAFTTDRTPEARDVYDRLQAATRISRTWGDAFGYLLVATGRAEIMIDPQLSLWDAAALQPIIEEAGGQFFDWQGRATVHSEEAVATNGKLATAVLACLGAS